MTKVEGLIGAESLGCRVVASPYTVHRANEVLWSVRRVEVNINRTKVAGTMLKNLEVVWGVGSVVGCWVANQ